VLRTGSTRIRNYADSDGETGTGGNFPLSHAAPRRIRTAQVVAQPHKLHSQLVGLVTAMMYQVTGLTSSFVYGRGIQPTGIINNNFASDAHHLLIFPRANRPTFAIIMSDGPGSLKHVSFDTNHLYQFITPRSILNATQLTKQQNMLK
jgi:hypothetical protein